MRSIVMSLALATLAGTASAQLAGVNGIHVVYGNGFNGWTSTTTTTNNGLSGFRIQENIGPNTDHSDGDFANRNFGFLSADGGATTYAYDGVSSFSITYRHRMAVSNSPVIPNGGAGTEGGLWFLQGGESHPYDDGGIFSTGNGTAFVGGMGAGFSILAQGDPNNPQSATHPGLTFGGWATFRFDYFAPGALGVGSPASYQASVLDETTGNFRISNLTSWDLGSAWPTGLQAGTAIGFRQQNVPVFGLDNNFDGEYRDIVIGAVVPTPASAGVLALAGLVGLRRRR